MKTKNKVTFALAAMLSLVLVFTACRAQTDEPTTEPRFASFSENAGEYAASDFSESESSRESVDAPKSGNKPDTSTVSANTADAGNPDGDANAENLKNAGSRSDSNKKNNASTTNSSVTADSKTTTKSVAGADDGDNEKKDSVSLAISCKNILANKSKLKDGKEYFVPSDGVILNLSKVEINGGDTVFDVLKRACTEKNIQLEYSYSAGFKTYYVEGINQIYEKDCGSKSGWMYSVNGVFPQVGCSAYTLKASDSVEFLYTCDGGGDLNAF